MVLEYEQVDQIGTKDIRSVVGSILSGNFHVFVEDLIGGYFGISRALFLSVLFFGLLSVLSIQIPNLPLFVAEWVIGTAPIWLPIGVIVAAWHVWIWYVRSRYIAKLDTMLLEIKMPKNLVRSPRAMENALSKLWTDSGETTFLNRVWQGQMRPYFSLEMASFGGEVHFYVWCWRSWRSVVEAALYAYYPEVEIVEAEDYAIKFRYDPDKFEVFGTDWRFEPKNDAYPIKTYIDFELDKDPKEEYRIDPLAEILERLSTLKPTEQMWVQIIITMCRDVRHKPGGLWWETQDRYTGLLGETADQIRKEALGDSSKPGEEWRRYSRMPQPGPAEAIKAIHRQMTKHPFNVVARGIYIADPTNFGSPGYTGIRWLWRPVANAQVGNQLRPRRWGNSFDWPWQDLFDMRWILHHHRFFDAYRRRGGFYSPWIFPHNMMSTETIATIWHPPTTAIVAPGLARIPSKKAEPPANIPK